MLSRFIDPTGTPRDRVFWLLLAAVISAQLLAFYALCNAQVRNAQVRHVVQTQQVEDRCLTPVAPSLAQVCASGVPDSALQGSTRRSSSKTQPAESVGWASR